MTWIASLGLAVLIGGLTLFGAGTVASLIVDWYNVSSFEGGAGFFVVGMALLGGIVGAAIGLVVARVEARRAGARFVRALGLAVAAVGAVLGAITLGAWLLADIPPQIDGEELFLVTEIRWPAADHPPPDTLDGVPYLRLGAMQGMVARRTEDGPVFIEDARREEGRWIVPGAVPVFTSRGGRLLDFGAGDRSIAGFMVPLPRYPNDAQREWSGWLPASASGEALAPDQFTYRFKVIRRSEPVRTETVGPFAIDTVADAFYASGDAARMAARATFRIRHRGAPILDAAVVDTVRVIAPQGTALLVTIAEPQGQPPCALLIDETGRLRIERLTGCFVPMTPHVLTSDAERFTAARTTPPPAGWVDHATFRQPGLLQIGSLVLDTRTFATTSFPFPDQPRPDVSLPPLGLSPDEQSFVWWAIGRDDAPQLGVTNWRTHRSYVLPVDRSRMRYTSEARLDPDWVRHHFHWVRDADGVDVLEERPGFIPLPHRGEVVLGKPGEYQSYTLSAGGEPLRDAVVEILVNELRAVRADSSTSISKHVQLDGAIVSVSVLGSPSYVHVSIDSGERSPAVMSKIAATLDGAIASGRYDALFVSATDKQP